jgi:cell division protein FtsZ
VFQEVKEEVAVRAEAEIPDEVTFEEPEALSMAFEEEVQEEMEPEVVAPVPETTAVPLPVARPRAEPVVQSRSQPEAEEPAPEPPPSAPRRSESVLSNVIVGQNAATAADKDMFQAGDEGRGRFKNTEPSLVEGEDLDVPTWMRLRKKLQR